MVKTKTALKISVGSALSIGLVLLIIKFLFSWTGIITSMIVVFLVALIGMKWKDWL